MPIYEYQCTHCHHHFDLLQKLSDQPTTQCPKCSQETATRLVSAAAFQLKGSGWYVTDFKNKGSEGANTKKEGSEPTETAATAKVSEATSSDSPSKSEASKTTDKTTLPQKTKQRQGEAN